MKCLWGQGNRYLRVNRKRIDISPTLARVVLAGVLVLIGAVFVLSDVGLWNLWKAEKRIAVTRERITDLERRNGAIQEEIDRLKKDPFTIEKVAREQYGYLMPGDRVYHIITLGVDDISGTSIPSSLDRESRKP